MATVPRSARRGPEGTREETDVQAQLQTLLDEATPGSDRARELLDLLAQTKEPFGGELQGLTEGPTATLPDVTLPDIQPVPEPFGGELQGLTSGPTATLPSADLEALLKPTPEPFGGELQGLAAGPTPTPPELHPTPQPPTPEPFGGEMQDLATATYPPTEPFSLTKAEKPLRLGAAQLAKLPGQLVYGIPAALTGLVADVTPLEDVPISARRTGGTRPSDTMMRDVSNWLANAAQQSQRAAEQITLSEGMKAETPVEHLGEWAGEYLFPYKSAAAIPAQVAKSFTVPLTATGVAARAGLTALTSDEIPIPSIVSTAEAGEDPLAKALGLKPTPALNTPTKVAPTPNAPTFPTTPVAPGSTIMPDGMVIPPPDMRTTTPPKVSRRTRKGQFIESEEDFKKRAEEAWIKKEVQARTYTPTAMEMFESVGGMQRMASSEYKILGVAAGTLVAAVFAPKIYARFAKAELPVARVVTEAAPGTVAVSRPIDLVRAQDDILAPLEALTTRAGVPQTAVDRVIETHRIQTRNGGRALADSAVEIGRMETPSYRFAAPVALNDLARQATPETDTYLKLWHNADVLTNTKPPTGGAAPTVPSPIGPQTITDILTDISYMEQANPALKDLQRAHQGWNKAVRKFQNDGEYATLTNKEYADLQTSSKNTLGGDKPITTGDAIAAQSDGSKGLIKARLDNEAVGKLVDEVRKVPPSAHLPGGGESLFVKISKDLYDSHPEWKPNTVTFKRKGVREYYTTDPFIADVLKTDHTMITGWSNIPYMTKRWLESTTTGVLAPNFSVTSAIRSYWIAKFTTEKGFRAPTMLGTALAIPQQLAPQVALAISHGLESGSNGILSRMFPQGWADGLSRRLAQVYADSVYAQLKAAGTHRGSYLEQQIRARGIQAATQQFNALAAANPAFRGAQHFWNAWKASIESVHSSVGFNFVKRNLGREGMPELALRARRLTGDPRTGGAYFVGEGRGRRPIRFEADNKLDQAVVDTLVKGYGYTAEVARQSVPWWNATLQGAKRIGEAYLHDPIRFTRSTALYAMAPAASLFYYAKALDAAGGDPKGRSYLDYLLNGRSAYNRQMNFYVPIPGKNAEDGIEITFFHELNPFKRGIEIALHHMLGSDVPKEQFWTSMPDNVTARRPLKDDLWTAAHMFLDTAIIPPMPPTVNAAMGLYGIRGPQGVFGGVAYPVKGDPFNQNGGLPTSLELATRALIGGVGESLAGFYAASTQSEGGYWNAVKNGLAQVRDINIKKTPILRDVTRIIPDISSVTDLSKEVFDNQKEFNDLSRFFKKWTVNEGKIGIKPASIGGNIALLEKYGLQQFNAANPGLQQPDPTNPLYLQFMEEFYNRFMKESPNFVKGEDNGGVGFKSLWRNYGQASQKLDRLKDVNHGTYDRWQREMEPDAKKELEAAGVDTTDRREVVNFYKKKQFDALRVINYVRRATEEILSKQSGRPMRLKDIKPFLPPQPSSEAPFMYEGLP
jgi:hypothetical protein